MGKIIDVIKSFFWDNRTKNEPATIVIETPGGKYGFNLVDLYIDYSDPGGRTIAGDGNLTLVAEDEPVILSGDKPEVAEVGDE